MVIYHYDPIQNNCWLGPNSDFYLAARYSQNVDVSQMPMKHKLGPRNWNSQMLGNPLLSGKLT